METIPVLYSFDYLDPLSYLVDLELAALADELPLSLRRHPLEMRPPPSPLLDPDGPEWSARWNQAMGAAVTWGVTLTAPSLIPWTRKAHEFVLHAQAKGRGDAAHAAVFAAVFRDGKDVGRVDVLVALGQGLGLDATETKAVLDVDRYTAEVASLGRAARESGVKDTPALARGPDLLQGFHNRDALRTFLLR